MRRRRLLSLLLLLLLWTDFPHPLSLPPSLTLTLMSSVGAVGVATMID
jgi:hypothetical protein